MTENVVTLVVVCYNHAPFLERCLESVASQSSDRFDLIVTDDASQDGSPDLIQRELARHGLQARLILHQRNVGVCATSNEALALVRTPLVAFLSTDDWMTRNRLEVQSERLLSLPESTALLYSNMFMVDASGVPDGRLYSDVLPPQWGFGQGHDLFQRLLRHDFVPAPAAMMRTRTLRDIGGFDETLSFEDYDVWLRLARQYDFAYLPQPLVFHRVWPNSLAARLRKDRRIDFGLSGARMFSKYLGVSPQADEVILEQVFRRAADAYKAGAPAASVLPYLRRDARSQRSWRPRVYQLAATMRVPGRWVGWAVKRAQSSMASNSRR